MYNNQIAKGHPMDKIQDYIGSCLFFNTNAFSRLLSKIAENEFKDLKLSPAHGTLMLIVYDNPGINPKDLSRHLQLTPLDHHPFCRCVGQKRVCHQKNKRKIRFCSPDPKRTIHEKQGG